MQRDSSTDSWDGIADEWVRHADTNDYRNFFLMPRMLAMLGNPSGLHILDLGCGEGGYARAMAERGAIVTAVDGSERLIEVARERTRDANVTYHAMNASALTLDHASFDVVVAAMSLMDVEDYDGAMRSSFDVLKPGGELLMSITHPCFMTPSSGWIRDENRKPLYLAVDRYFERTAWPEFIAEHFTKEVLRRHRPLEDYMNGAVRAGFILREFAEPQPTEDERKLSRRFDKIARVPYFLFLRWSK